MRRKLIDLKTQRTALLEGCLLYTSPPCGLFSPRRVISERGEENGDPSKNRSQ